MSYRKVVDGWMPDEEQPPQAGTTATSKETVKEKKAVPVDKQLLESSIIEAAGDDKEMADFLRDRYSKNDALAAKFVGGFTRTADYSRKTQELAAQRKEVEGQSAELKTQLDNARIALTSAETEKNKILSEVAGHRMTVGKAKSLLEFLQEKYQLTDEDLPGMSDLIETAKKGKPVDTTDPLTTRLAALKAEIKAEVEKSFVDALKPELGAMAHLPLVWQDIAYEHEQLTGKRLSFAEQQEILKIAREKNASLRAVWEEKYQISGDNGLRMQKRDENLKKQWESDRDKADAEKRQKEALEVVTPVKRELGDGAGISAAFKTKFRQFEMDPDKPASSGGDGVPSLKVEPGQHVRQSGAGRVPAAQRAAAKFLERQAGKSTGAKVA